VPPGAGERYLTTPLFEGVAEDMDADEVRNLEVDPGAIRCRSLDLDV
jgi:hypothetical protein